MKKYILFFLIFFTFNNNGILSKDKKFENKYYSLLYFFTKKDKIVFLNLTLTPKKGFKLNGDGYPPINIEFKEIIKDNNKFFENKDSKIIFNPKKISYQGIKEKEKKDFVIEITNNKEKFFIEIAIKAIPCDNASCYMSNEKIIIEY